MMLSAALARRPLLALLVSALVLSCALAASAMNAAPARADARWDSSFAPIDAGFAIDLPGHERRWIRATDLAPGLEGFTCRDPERHALYTVIFGAPAKTWTLGDARAYLARGAAADGDAKLAAVATEGRHGFELIAHEREGELRCVVLLDGARVVIVSRLAADDRDDARFFGSLAFTAR